MERSGSSLIQVPYQHLHIRTKENHSKHEGGYPASRLRINSMLTAHNNSTFIEVL